MAAAAVTRTKATQTKMTGAFRGQHLSTKDPVEPLGISAYSWRPAEHNLLEKSVSRFLRFLKTLQAR